MPAEFIEFSDGHWIDAHHPDFAHHQRIDNGLRNGFPAIPPEKRELWLRPALERLRHEQNSESNCSALRGLIRQLLPHSFQSALPPDLLPLLVELGPILQRNRLPADCDRLNECVASTLAFHKKPIAPDLIPGLRRFVGHLLECHCHGMATFDIAWRLWRDPAVQDDPQHCLATIVRCALRAASPEERQSWDRLWEARGKNRDPHNFIGLPYRNLLSGIVKKIGHREFAGRFQEWIASLSAATPVVMTAACRELVRLLLHACRAVPELPVEETLQSLSAIRWAGQGNARLQKEWLGELLEALAVRPPQPSLAAVEILAANPTTCTFIQVALVREWLTADTQASLPDLETGIDGYPIRKRPEHRVHQLTLDRHLRACTPSDRDPATQVESVWRAAELCKLLTMRCIAADPAAYCEAIAAHRKWLNETRRKPATRTVQVGSFTFEETERDHFESWLWALSSLEDELAALPQSTLPSGSIVHLVTSVSLSSSPISDQTFDMVKSHIAADGYSAELVEAMRQWHRSLRGARAMTLRRRLEWLLWFEDVQPIDTSLCWGETVRLDIRKMPAAQRAAWTRLFETATAGLGPTPTKPWRRSAPKLIKAIGPVRFRTQFRQWFAPFRDAAPQRLTVAGRDALRLLIFTALAAADPQVDEALEWLASAKWKTRKDRDHFEKAVPALLQTLADRSPEAALRTRESLLAYSRRRPITPPPDPAAFERQLLAKLLEGPSAKVEGDELIVTGARHTYAISLTGQSIVRRTDGRAVTIAPAAFDDLLRPFPGPAIVRRQLELKLTADLLVHDDLNEASIEVERVQ